MQIINSGLFITLYDEKTLSLYLKYGIYGFLMKPVFTGQPSARSKRFAVLADYACSRERTHVFFFLKRKIIYGGIVKGNKELASFYLNGNTSPLGRKSKAELFWNESIRYTSTDKEGVFIVKGTEKAQPFTLQFMEVKDLSGKQIASDDYYFELGKYPYPLPSNTKQDMGFCTLTPGETKIAISLLERSSLYFDGTCSEDIQKGDKQTLFKSAYIDREKYISEAQLEFNLLADLEPIKHLFPDDNYILCRQVPLSPFKPYNLDRADICLYSISNNIKDGTIPNVIIELKKDKANFNAYNQIHRYLEWLQKITKPAEFNSIVPILVAPDFNINKKKIKPDFLDKIKLFSLAENKTIEAIK